MNITFLRHATAQDRELPINDFDRTLIDKGILQSEKVVSFCSKNKLTPDILLTSPYPRALQTANYLFQNLVNCPKPIISEWLKLESDPLTSIKYIHTYIGKTNELWLVGHEPDFSLIIEKLMQMKNSSIKIKKASLTRVELQESGHASIIFSIPCSYMC